MTLYAAGFLANGIIPTYTRLMLDNRPTLPPEIARRRTFAIISHPDAGKTHFD